MPSNPSAERLIADLRTLATIGRKGQGLYRRAFSEQDLEARLWVKARMEEAGLETSLDSFGNLIGYTPGCERYVLIGSHTDTVPNGGWLDGALGVMAGLEVARVMPPGRETGVAVISFSDEEGRFCPLLGSQLFCGHLSPQSALGLVDESGTALADARAQIGLSGDTVLRLDPSRHVAYLELHIEQGPLLEHEGLEIGIVSDIVGIARARVRLRGQADHAGTTPMALRRDAARGAYLFAEEFHRFCSEAAESGSVWNLGGIRAEPGAFNVVAERAEILVEFRSSSSDSIRLVQRQIPILAQAAAQATRTDVEILPAGAVAPVEMSAWVTEVMARAATALGFRPKPMVSGAGHDAMTMAPHVPTAMLFIPSLGGRSHTPEEHSTDGALAAGLAVLSATADELLAQEIQLEAVR
jgi:N-carbamoyl-L-amino-acid hydrolase